METGRNAFSLRGWPRMLLVGFVLATLIRVWLGPIISAPTAVAQIPDAGAQRMQLLEETRKTNQLLTEIRQILLTHTFNVRAAGADNTGTDN
ncbi:MAG: hypothetical protein J5J06_19710 [Phycisphaerae bacterium]|nr:hypothetical protein [Phycisphaerae bacterium]